MVQLIGFNLLAGGQHPQRDGQIKTGPFLPHVGGRQVDGGAAHGKFESGVRESGGHPIPGFLHRRIREADNDHHCVAPTGVDLDLDRVGLNAVDGGGTNPG